MDDVRALEPRGAPEPRECALEPREYALEPRESAGVLGVAAFEPERAALGQSVPSWVPDSSAASLFTASGTKRNSSAPCARLLHDRRLAALASLPRNRSDASSQPRARKLPRPAARRRAGPRPRPEAAGVEVDPARSTAWGGTRRTRRACPGRPRATATCPALGRSALGRGSGRERGEASQRGSRRCPRRAARPRRGTRRGHGAREDAAYPSRRRASGRPPPRLGRPGGELGDARVAAVLDPDEDGRVRGGSWPGSGRPGGGASRRRRRARRRRRSARRRARAPEKAGCLLRAGGARSATSRAHARDVEGAEPVEDVVWPAPGRSAGAYALAARASLVTGAEANLRASRRRVGGGWSQSVTRRAAPPSAPVSSLAAGPMGPGARPRVRPKCWETRSV